VIVEQLRHDEQTVRRRGRAAGAGRLERLEIALGDVDHVADDVPHLPVPAGGRLLPVLGDLGELEHALGFLAHGLQQLVFAGGVRRVPLRLSVGLLGLGHDLLPIVHNLTNDSILRRGMMRRRSSPD
jgi:hypothetical protein